MDQESCEGSVVEALVQCHWAIEEGIQDVLAARDQRVAKRIFGVLRSHIWLEEERILPCLSGVLIRPQIRMIELEHGQVWRLAARATTADSDELEATCRELVRALGRHNAKEERVIYGRLYQKISSGQCRDLDLGTRDMPEGWTCNALSKEFDD